MTLLEQRKFSASMDSFAEMWAELQPLAHQEREQAAAEAGAAAGSSAAHALLHRAASAIHDCAQQPDQTPPPARQPLAPPPMLARSDLPSASPGKAGSGPVRYSWSNACHSNALYDMSPDTSLTSPPSSFRAPQHVAMRRLSMALAAQPIAEECSAGQGEEEGPQPSGSAAGVARKAQQAQQRGIFLQLQDESFDWWVVWQLLCGGCHCGLAPGAWQAGQQHGPLHVLLLCMQDSLHSRRICAFICLLSAASASAGCCVAWQ